MSAGTAQTREFASAIAARLDRLPMTPTLWRLVTLISLGRAIFVWALVWYSVCSAIMAFQSTAVGIDLWRFLAGIGVGLEQVTIDAYLPEFVPPKSRGKAFAYYQFVEFSIVPVVALLGWL